MSNRFKSPSPGPNNGFVVLALVMCLPLLAVALAWMWGSFFTLYSLRTDRLTCRNELVQAQRSAGERIENLLLLNVTSSRLRTEFAAAQVALAAALAHGNAPAATAARLWIKRIQVQRKALILSQKKNIWLGQMGLQKAVFNIQKYLQKGAQKNSEVRTQTRGFQVSTIRMAVKRLNPGDKFPEYEPVLQFSRRQGVELNWQTLVQPQTGGLKKWIRYDSLWPNHCGATLRQIGNRFQVVPTSPAKY